MARSMTAYGRAHAKTAAGLFLIEIHSVNRKSLDINTNLPKELLCLDMGLRSRLAEIVKRGYLTVRITKEGENGRSFEIPSVDVLKKVHEEWKACASQLGYKPEEAVPFSLIMQYASGGTALTKDLDERLEKELFQGFDEAVAAFMEMKEGEGKALSADIFPRLGVIEAEIKKVKELSKLAPKRYHDYLARRLNELKIHHEADEDRLTREMVLFADKIDVTEEIIRLSSHVKQFIGILRENKARVGRELDFLAQEMSREVNTIAAKSQELKITQATLNVKSELEKIREQLANIE